MNMTAGCNLCAKLNVAAINLFDSPQYLFNILDNCNGKNIAHDSFAKALAIMVFPVPGLPYNNTPLTGCINLLLVGNKCGCSKGTMANSYISCFIESNPPISANVHSISSGSIISSAICNSLDVNTGTTMFLFCSFGSSLLWLLFPPALRLIKICFNRRYTCVSDVVVSSTDGSGDCRGNIPFNTVRERNVSSILVTMAKPTENANSANRAAQSIGFDVSCASTSSLLDDDDEVLVL